VDALSAMLHKKFSQQVSVAGSHTSALAAIEEIESLVPDIVFLDVEMPEMNGLDVLKHFPGRSFHVIFTTAHEKYALPALKAAATDYLVKPLSPQDVFEAIQKCIIRKNEIEITVPASQRLSLATSQGILVVHTDDILRIEAHNNYSHFHFANRPKLILSKTLGEFDDQLSGQGFYRVHQSHLINLKYVESIHHSDGDYVLLKGNHRVEISRRRKADFIQLLKKP
jgi:two-component system LytT family response regulator